MNLFKCDKLTFDLVPKEGLFPSLKQSTIKLTLWVLIMELQDILDHTVDHSIVQEERIHIKERINSFNFDTPFYVYCLCFPNGQPFYIGKGKNYRIFDHFKSDFTNKNKTEVISDIQQSGSYPIMHIIKGNLSEEEALL